MVVSLIIAVVRIKTIDRAANACELFRIARYTWKQLLSEAGILKKLYCKEVDRLKKNADGESYKKEVTCAFILNINDR